MPKITVQADVPTGQLEAVVDAELKEFDVWFQGLGNLPLVKPELAILKTYLAFKMLKRGE